MKYISPSPRLLVSAALQTPHSSGNEVSRSLELQFRLPEERLRERCWQMRGSATLGVLPTVGALRNIGRKGGSTWTRDDPDKVTQS